MYLIETLAVLAIALGVVALVRLLTFLILPTVRADGVKGEVVLGAEGDAPDLEFAIRAAERLAARGGIPLVLIDRGLSREARYIAERMAYGGRFTIKDE